MRTAQKANHAPPPNALTEPSMAVFLRNDVPSRMTSDAPAMPIAPPLKEKAADYARVTMRTDAQRLRTS